MEEQGFRLVELDGITVARCEALHRVPGIAHAFSTRRESASSDFDLGSAEDDTRGTRDRRARFLEAAGLESRVPAILRQVHGARVVPAAAWGDPPPEADASFWTIRDDVGPVPSVRTADCVPILLAGDAGSLAAAVHAGWRGIAAGIVPSAVAVLVQQGGVPADLRAALGPCILSCCYEVGDEVVRQVTEAAPDAVALSSAGVGGRFHLDLHAAVRAQLIRAGVPPAAIHAAPWCTRCRKDLFFSYRRDGAGTGRMMAAIGPAPRP